MKLKTLQKGECEVEREGCAILKIKELIRQVLTALLNVKPWPDTDLLKIFSEINFQK